MFAGTSSDDELCVIKKKCDKTVPKNDMKVCKLKNLFFVIQ